LSRRSKIGRKVDAAPGNDFGVRNGGNCLLFQLFAAIFQKFIFLAELEKLLGKRRAKQAGNLVGGSPPG
jgi:hypothetical protein